MQSLPHPTSRLIGNIRFTTIPLPAKIPIARPPFNSFKISWSKSPPTMLLLSMSSRHHRCHHLPGTNQLWHYSFRWLEWKSRLVPRLPPNPPQPIAYWLIALRRWKPWKQPTIKAAATPQVSKMPFFSRQVLRFNSKMIRLGKWDTGPWRGSVATRWRDLVLLNQPATVAAAAGLQVHLPRHLVTLPTTTHIKNRPASCP